jgi:hypothetical protein
MYLGKKGIWERDSEGIGQPGPVLPSGDNHPSMLCLNWLSGINMGLGIAFYPDLPWAAIFLPTPPK